jgi:hypothetical protein
MRGGRVRRYEQERPEAPRLRRVAGDQDRSGEDVGPVHGEVLRLQQAGGNEAVGTLLQRDATAPQDAVPADTGNAVSSTLVLDDKLGVLPLLTFSKGRRENEWVVSVPSTDKDADIARYGLQGVKIEKAVISTTNFDITLTDVYITSWRGGGDPGESREVSFTLNFGAQDFKPAGEKKPLEALPLEPAEHGVRHLGPAAVDGERVALARELPELRHRGRLRVQLHRLLGDRGRDRVVAAAGREQQRAPRRVARVDLGRRAGGDVGQRRLEQCPPRGRDRPAHVEVVRFGLADGVAEAVAELLARERHGAVAVRRVA